MTKETLEKAKEIDWKLKRLYDVLNKLEENDCELYVRCYGETILDQSFNKPIKILIRNEIYRLEEELKSL